MSFFGSFANCSASSRSVVKNSSHMSNKVKRQVARVAVDSFQSMLPGGRNITYNGKKYPKLAGELGDEDFRRYSADPPILSLQKIHYCQYRLEQLKDMASGSFESSKKELEDLSGEELTTEQAQGVQKIRGLVNHEYLVLEVQSSPTDKLYILAQKFAGKDEAGIHIQKAEPADYDENQVLLHAIACCGVPMKLDRLQSLLLEADTPHYDLRDNNCWDYATRATKRLLKECIARVADRDEVKTAQLQNELRELEANLSNKGMVNTLKEVARWSTRVSKNI